MLESASKRCNTMGKRASRTLASLEHCAMEVPGLGTIGVVSGQSLELCPPLLYASLRSIDATDRKFA
jgi:hypothetical protein